MGMQTISLNGLSTGSQRAGLGPQRALNGQLVLSTGTLPIVEPGVGWGMSPERRNLRREMASRIGLRGGFPSANRHCRENAPHKTSLNRSIIVDFEGFARPPRGIFGAI